MPSTTSGGATHHIVPHKSGWALRREGAQRVSAVFSTKDEALEHGMGLARHQKSALVVYGRDGTIEEKVDYCEELTGR